MHKKNCMITPVGVLLCFVVTLLVLSIVTADQICAPLNQQGKLAACPKEPGTCCNQTICNETGSKYKCCPTGTGIGCSSCPTCS